MPRKPTKTPDFTEIAVITDGQDITRPYYLQPLLDYQDRVMKSRGGSDLEIYEELLRDEQVGAAMGQRRLKLQGWEWQVEPGRRRFMGETEQDIKFADYLRETLDAIPFDQITGKMHWGVFYGYAVGEMMYARDGQYIVLDDARGGIKVRKARRFRYTPEMELRMVTLNNRWEGEPLDPWKFWDFSFGDDNDDNPYGAGLGQLTYWPVTIKRQGIQAWVMFLKRFGLPFILGKYPPGALEEDQRKLKAVVRGFASGTGGIIPEGMLLELIEASRSGTADYDALHGVCDRAIAKAILGGTMTLEAEGGQYKGDVHENTLEDLTKADADIISQSFQEKVLRPLAWYNRANFGEDVALPQVWRVPPSDEDIARTAKIYVDLKTAGFEPVSVEQVNTTFGGEWKRIGVGGTPTSPGVPEPALPPEFAAAVPVPVDQAELDAYLAELTDEELQAQMEPILQPLIERLQAADGAGALAKLEQLYPSLDTSGLEELLARAFFVAEVWGRINAEIDPAI